MLLSSAVKGRFRINILAVIDATAVVVMVVVVYCCDSGRRER